MEDSLDRHVVESSPRRLLRNFMEVMEPKDTPAPLRNRAVTSKERLPQKSLSSSKQRSKPRRSRDEENLHSEALRHQAGQSSFMDQTLSMSVIQGINQTYANIVAPDSDNSSVNSSIDLEKGARFHRPKKRKLETAPLPPGMISLKRKNKKRAFPSSDATSTSNTKEAGSRQDIITNEAVVQEAQDKPKQSSTTAGDQTYANIVAPDSDNSSVNSSIDLEKGARFHILKKRKLETASLPPDMITKSSMKIKNKKTAFLSSDATSTANTEEAVSRQDIITDEAVVQEAQDKPKQPSTKVGDQTYANIVAPDSDNSSVNSSIDLERGARFHRLKKRKLETAPLPPDMITKPSMKIKNKKTAFPSSDATSTANTEEAVSRQDIITDEAVVQEARDKPKQPSTKAGTAGKKIHSLLPEATSPKGGVDPEHQSVSSDVSSIGTDATYEFSADYDDTLSDIMEAKRRFNSQLASRKLNLPSLIGALQAKQKSGSLVTLADIVDTLDVPDMLVASPEKTTQEAQETTKDKLNTSHSPFQNVEDDAIPPPLSFRDNEMSRSAILREADFSDTLHTSKILFRLEETEADLDQDQLPKTPAPPEDESLVIDLQKSSSALKTLGHVTDASNMKTPTGLPQRKSLGEITDASSTKSSQNVQQISGASTTTPTHTSSSLRESVSQAPDATTLTKLSPRKSVDQVTNDTARTTPTKLSLGKSMEQITGTTTTPTRVSPKRNPSQAIVTQTSPRSVEQVTDVTTMKTPTRSSPRSVEQVTDVTTMKTPTRSSPRSIEQVTDVTTMKTTTRSSPRSVEQVTDVTTMKTPTGSSPRSIEQVTDVTTMKTPTRSSPRSIEQVTDVTTMKTPTRSSPRSIEQVTDVTTMKTPTRSSPRSIEEVADVTTMKTPTRSSPRSIEQVTDVTTMKTPTRSSPRSVEQVTDVTTMKTPTRSSRIVEQATDVTSMKTSTRASPRSVEQGTDITPMRTLTRSSPRSLGDVTTVKTPIRSSSRSVGEVTDITTMKTPTSSLPRNVGQVTGVTTMRTPTGSPPRSVSQLNVSGPSLRRNVVHVTNISTAKTPTESSSSRSMSQVTDITTTRTPTKSSPRSVGQVSSSKPSVRRSVSQVSDITTTRTPMSSSRSVGQVTYITSTRTPTSSLRRSVDQVSASKSSPRSVGQADGSITLPTRSSPRQNSERSSLLVSPQKGDMVDNTVSGGSAGRSRNTRAQQKDATAVITTEERDEIEEEGSPEKRSSTGKSLPEDDAESTLFSDIEDDFSLIPVTVRPSFGHMQDIVMRNEEEAEISREASSHNIEALPSLPETSAKQTLAPSSTAKVRQMTMREFLEQLKKKPVQPPLAKPKPLLPTLLGAAEPSTRQSKPQGRPKGKTKSKKKQLPASLPQRLTKEIFTHFAKCRVTKGALAQVMKVTEIFWENLTKDACAMQSSKKNPTKSIQHQDVEKLMKRQGVITSQESLDALVEQLLPMEMWSLFKTFPEPAHNPFPSFDGPFFNP